MDAPAFPSDTYAIKSHLRQRGFDPDEHLIIVNSGTEEPTAPEALEAAIAAAGDTLALGMIAGVNFLTGQVHPIARITKALHNVGALAGWDLARAAGNIHLQLHEDQVDFAAWCSYKYLSTVDPEVCPASSFMSGTPKTPIARGLVVGGGTTPQPDSRCIRSPTFIPCPLRMRGNCPTPILALAPLRSALALFDEVGMPKARARSQRLTGWLRKQLPSLGRGHDSRKSTRRLNSRCGWTKPMWCNSSCNKKGWCVMFENQTSFPRGSSTLYNSYEDAFRLVRALTMAHESGST